MDTFEPNKAIVPIVKAAESDPIAEILGTGAFVGVGEKLYLLTARHVFEGAGRKDPERFAFVLNDGRGIGIWAMRKIAVSKHYDIALCQIKYVEGMIALPFSSQQPSLNDDVFCFEYSNTRVTTKPTGGKRVSFEPLAHKGNVMRYFESDYPESIVTPSFNTSFPALQGASGAPVIAHTKDKNFYIAGLMVANQDTPYASADRTNSRWWWLRGENQLFPSDGKSDQRQPCADRD